MTDVEQAILDFLNAHPEATIVDVSAAFNLSPDEAEGVLQSIYDKLRDEVHE